MINDFDELNIKMAEVWDENQELKHENQALLAECKPG
jgi:hypothetical protein